MYTRCGVFFFGVLGVFYVKWKFCWNVRGECGSFLCSLFCMKKKSLVCWVGGNLWWDRFYHIEKKNCNHGYKNVCIDDSLVFPFFHSSFMLFKTWNLLRVNNIHKVRLKIKSNADVVLIFSIFVSMIMNRKTSWVSIHTKLNLAYTN